MPDYAGLATTSARLVSDFGRNVTLRQLAASGADPWNPSLASTDTVVKATVTTYSAREIGDLVQADDKKILFASTIEPKTQDRIVDGSTEYQIVSVRKVQPGDTALLYIVQARI